MGVIFGLLIFGTVSLNGCTVKLPPNGADGRPCYLGIVTEATLSITRQLASDAKVGDLLISRQCDDSQTEEILNDVRRMSHEK
jgi:hypothetical protein